MLDQAKAVWKRVVDFSDAHFPIIRNSIAVEKELPCFEDLTLKAGQHGAAAVTMTFSENGIIPKPSIP